MAELDVLMAFAEAAEGTGEGPMCRPHLLPDDAEPVSASFATGPPLCLPYVFSHPTCYIYFNAQTTSWLCPQMGQRDRPSS